MLDGAHSGRLHSDFSRAIDGTVVGRKAVMGVLSPYLDFINMFMMLLRLFGDRR